LPSGLIYLNSSATKGSYNSTNGLWIIANLDNGESATLYLTVRVVKPGNITNTIEITSIVNNTGDNIATSTIKAIYKDNITIVAKISADGKTMYISGKLTDEFCNPLSNKIVKFYLNNKYIGYGITNNDGIALIEYTSQSAFKNGNYTILDSFDGDDDYRPCSNMRVLSVNFGPNETNKTNKTNKTNVINKIATKINKTADTSQIAKSNGTAKVSTGVDKSIAMKKTGNPIVIIAIIILLLLSSLVIRRKKGEN
jgi:hypothetical protein